MCFRGLGRGLALLLPLMEMSLLVGGFELSFFVDDATVAAAFSSSSAAVDFDLAGAGCFVGGNGGAEES